MVIEIINIWLKIIGIIALWEAWKYVAWELINKWVDYKIREHERGKRK